jgi:hypothetical protein
MAEDSGCTIGGDGSVQYRVVMNNARPGTVISERTGSTSWVQGGIDETPVKGDFTVTLKIPESSARFVKSLIKAAAAATKYSGKVGKEIRFVIPIEPDSPGQIQVNWESAPAKSSGKRGVAAKSTSASRKKR